MTNPAKALDSILRIASKSFRLFSKLHLAFEFVDTCLTVPRVGDRERGELEGKRKLAVAKGKVAAKIQKRSKKSNPVVYAGQKAT